MARGRARVGLVAAACLGVAAFAAACDDSRAQQAEARRESHAYRVVEIARGLEHPWALAFLPGGDILVTERAGRVRMVRGGQLLPQAVPGGPRVWAQGQGGLLDVALAPDFASSRYVYFSYAKPIGDGQATTAVARARLEGDRLEGLADVLVADAGGAAGQHFGSRLLFDRDGMLWVTVGERGQMQPAQDLTNHVGKTLRIHPDGRAPRDNPFVGRPGARPEIFSYGHRNAQGMALHPGTGAVWQNEHGPRGGDEVNLIRPGANYGWPLASEGAHYGGGGIPGHDQVEGVEAPRLSWVPAIAPSGMAFYTGDRFPRWQGHQFHGSLIERHLRRVAFEGDRAVEQEVLLGDFGERIRDVRVGPDGYIYVLTDEPDGVLARLEPAD